jgi:hypothetical protein
VTPNSERETPIGLSKGLAKGRAKGLAKGLSKGLAKGLEVRQREVPQQKYHKKVPHQKYHREMPQQKYHREVPPGDKSILYYCGPPRVFLTIAVRQEDPLLMRSANMIFYY